MNRPNIFAYLIGNIVSVIIIVIATIVVTYQAWQGAGSWVVAIVMIVILGSAMNAAHRIDSYRTWKRDWDAMGGGPPPGVTLPRLPGLRVAGGLIIWAIFAIGAVKVAADPGMQLPVALFWLGSLLLAGRGFYVLARRNQVAVNTTTATRDTAVAICLPLPRQSPTVNEAMQALPEYCAQVMRGIIP